MVLFIVLLWFLGFLFFWKIYRINLPAEDHLSCPPLSIIIPARNEENNLGRLLRSLAGQLSFPSEIIVVDDHSEDATARVAQGFSVRIIPSSDLPPGWRGKTWACWQGAQQARNDRLLFLDADTFFEPYGLSRLRTYFEKKGGVLSLQPFHVMHNAYEQLSAFFNIIILAGSNAFTILGKRLKPRGGFGPCIMCRKEDYFRIGGHQAVASWVIEHFILGREFQKAGLEIFCLGGKGVLNFQMYPEGFSSMVGGFIKSFAVGSQAISPFSLVAISAWITGAMASTRYLLESLVFSPWTQLETWIMIELLFAIQIFWMLRRIGNFKWYTSLFFPIPLLFFVLVFFVSLIKSFFIKKVTWKGRTLNPDR